ncbi:MAG: class I SAM-dependent methyltransferase [Eubacterium sp.]|nr:class I SAM-dependent methyltransferase [Eubacterium sp.]
MNRVEYYEEPLQQLFKDLDEFTPEMSKYESSILSGLIKKYCPQKIVELGVAEGATTCLIMKTLDSLGKMGDETFEVHSVDLNENLYYDAGKKTGYQYIKACESGFVNDSNHYFHIGQYLPEVIDEIGDGIDFIILDTVHKAPGELMDLLVCLPYLSPNAIIAFHDTLYCYGIDTGDRARHINMLCFNVLRGKKYMNLEKQEDQGYASFGAVEINDDTLANVEDLFMLFCFPWFYLLSDKEFNLYKDKYMELYGESYTNLFVQFSEMNTINFRNNINYSEQKFYESEREEFIRFCKKGNIFLYGTGSRGQMLYEFLKGLEYEVDGFVVSDGYRKEECIRGLPVLELSDIKEDVNIIVASCFLEVLENLKVMNKNFYVPSPTIIEQAMKWNEFK